MGTLWDQLLGYARSRQQQKPPTIRKDLWDAVEQLQELRAVVEQLVAEVETQRNQINHLKLQVAVLESHEWQRRRNSNG